VQRRLRKREHKKTGKGGRIQACKLLNQTISKKESVEAQNRRTVPRVGTSTKSKTGPSSRKGKSTQQRTKRQPNKSSLTQEKKFGQAGEQKSHQLSQEGTQRPKGKMGGGGSNRGYLKELQDRERTKSFTRRSGIRGVETFTSRKIVYTKPNIRKKRWYMGMTGRTLRGGVLGQHYKTTHAHNRIYVQSKRCLPKTNSAGGLFDK